MTHSFSFLYNFIGSQKLRNETLQLFLFAWEHTFCPSALLVHHMKEVKEGLPRKLDLRQIPFSPAASNPWFTLQILRHKPIARFLRDLHSSADKTHYMILCRNAGICLSAFNFTCVSSAWCRYLLELFLFCSSPHALGKLWRLLWLFERLQQKWLFHLMLAIGPSLCLTVSWRNTQPTLIIIVRWPYHYFQGAFDWYQ